MKRSAIDEKDAIISHYKALVRQLAGPRELGHCKECGHYYQLVDMTGCDMGCETRCENCTDGDVCILCENAGCHNCVWVCNEPGCHFVLCDHCRDLGHREKHKCPMK